MTPAEHRAAAEAWLEDVSRGYAAVPSEAIAAAQAHALLAQAPPPPPEAPAAKVDVKRAVYVQAFTGDLIEVSKHPDGLYLGCDTPDGDWSALITDPTQARLMADALAAHAQRMETNR